MFHLIRKSLQTTAGKSCINHTRPNRRGSNPGNSLLLHTIAMKKPIERSFFHNAATRIIINSKKNTSSHMNIFRNKKYSSTFYNIKRSFTKSSAATAVSSASSKTVGDYFLDNLGKIFLSTIFLIIGSLIRSSLSTSNQNKCREQIETCSTLDPFEIHDLRITNVDVMDKEMFRTILMSLMDRYTNHHNLNNNNNNNINIYTDDDHKSTMVDYREFISVVMNIMKKLKGEGYTIQLSHLLDRLIIDLLLKKKENREKLHMTNTTTVTTNSSDASNSSTLNYTDSNNDDGKLDLSLLLVALSLCLNSTIRERVELLFDIMVQRERYQSLQKNDNNNNNNYNYNTDRQEESSKVSKNSIIDMINYLQITCQLVPDAQVVTSDVKYPVQQYRVGTAEELTNMGIVMKKEELNEELFLTKKGDIENEKEDDQKRGTWTCDDFHHLLRSRAVCAWGECYVKKKGLQD